METPVKVFEVRLEAGKGGFEFERFDVPNVDALMYVLGYIAGCAFGDPKERFSKEALDAINKLEPDHRLGLEHGWRVNRGETKPAWHTAELDLLVTFALVGVINLDTLIQILHDRARQAGKHKCKPHTDEIAQKTVGQRCGSGEFTSKEVLKA